VLKRRDGSPFIGRPASSAGAKAKQWWKLQLFPHRPKTPINEPLVLRLEITYPWRVKDARIARTAASIPMSVKPDIDNLMKLILDAMTGCGFWADDALVTDLTCSKRLGAKPGLTVEIRTFPDEPKTTTQQTHLFPE
jgi:Holliday junction resolvase RusA-like endonuclease